MSCSWRLFLFAQILLLAGCQPSAPPRAIESLALLPLDNLSGDRALDWLGRGAQLALHRQLAASRTVAAAAYPEVASATLGRATRLLHTTVDKHAGQLRLEAVIEDALTHRQVGDRIILQVPPEQIPGGLNQLARRLANDAAVGPSQNPEALAAFVEAESASERQAKIAALTRAAGLDPQFALPLITLAELQLAAGKRDEAQSALNALAARQLDPIERAQAGLLQANLAQANLAQASPQRAQALEKLAVAAPLQANLQLFAATQLQSLHQMAPVVEAYNRVLRLDPGNAEIWNRLGYANAYLGRLPAARAALETFQKLEPDNANALDSLGEVHYLSGEFKQAAGYFQAAYSKSPQFSAGRAMLKAAYALLLDGKMAAADQAAAQYAKSAGQFPAAEVAHAHWLYSRGQPTEALAYLAAAAAKSAAPVAAIYQSHRCGLLLRTDRAAAQAAARAAMTTGPSAPAVLCFFLSQPSASPAAWTAMAERNFSLPAGRAFGRQALAYALFFDRHYAEALPLIEALAAETNPDADSEIRVWLAECQWRTGHWDGARQTLAHWPLPASETIFGGLHLPATLQSILRTGEHFGDRAVAQRWSPIAKETRRSFE